MTVVAVPALGLTIALWLVAALFVVERAGKAIRGPARDVMISYAATAIGRGKGFAVHEALDQAGGVAGPLLVAAVLAATAVRGSSRITVPEGDRSGYRAGVEVGFAPPVSGSWATPEHMIHVARRSEQLGYHSLWTFQRLLVPADLGWSETYHSVHDPLTTLAFLAAHTTRIRLGVAVLNMPFISPVVLAKQAATLDILAGGRLDVGLGLGWADEEYQATGASRHRRGRRAEEFLAVLRALWQHDVAEHRGEFYQVPPTRLAPKPVQRPHPPILLGGHAPAALRRAGRLADGWVSGSQADLTSIAGAVATVKAAAADAGRDPRSLRFVCRGAVRVRPTGPAGREPLTGTLEQIRSDLRRLTEAGITELFVDLNFDPEIGSPRADARASLRRADEVLDALAPAR